MFVAVVFVVLAAAIVPVAFGVFPGAVVAADASLFLAAAAGLVEVVVQ